MASRGEDRPYVDSMARTVPQRPRFGNFSIFSNIMVDKPSRPCYDRADHPGASDGYHGHGAGGSTRQTRSSPADPGPPPRGDCSLRCPTAVGVEMSPTWPGGSTGTPRGRGEGPGGGGPSSGATGAPP